jgi:hypothetical protein
MTANSMTIGDPTDQGALIVTGLDGSLPEPEAADAHALLGSSCGSPHDRIVATPATLGGTAMPSTVVG